MTQAFTSPITSRLKGGLFNPLEFNPYLLFDAQTSMLGELEAPTLDLDASDESTLDVITATRAGVATYTDLHGTIKTASADTVRVDHVQGEELTPTKYQLVGYTDFSSGWNKSKVTEEDGDGYDGQVSKVLTVTSDDIIYRQNSPTTAGVVYTASIYARLISGTGTLKINHQNSPSGSNTAVSITSEWQRFEVSFIGLAGTTPVGIRGMLTGDVIEVSSLQVEEGTTATDFVPNTTGSPKFIASATYGPRVPMMLIEPTATNLVTHSEDFSDNSWYRSPSIAPVETDSISSPANTLTADKLILNNGETIGLLKVSSTDRGTATNPIVEFTLEGDGTFAIISPLPAGGEASVVAIENGWYRCSLYDPPANETLSVYAKAGEFNTIRLQFYETQRNIYVKGSGDGTSGLYLWGAQVETGSVATSYIPTSGGSVAERTRNADNLVIDGTAFSDFYNGSEGTFYLEAQSKQPEKQTALLRGGGNTRLFLYTNTDVAHHFYDGTSVVTFGNVTANKLSRFALSYNSTNVTASLDGSENTGSASGNLAAADRLQFGQGYGEIFNGHYKRLIYWPTHSSSL